MVLSDLFGALDEGAFLGLVGSPKASVIESRSSLLVKGERQPGATGFATLLRGCNCVAKVPYAHKKTTA